MNNPKLEVLTPQNSQLIIIDHQPQMAFGVQSIDRQTMKNNVVGMAKAVMKIVTEHSGAYGMGVDYACTMVHKAAARNQGHNEVLAPVPAPVR
ncbi:hypothetical protein [Massilia aerilata]|uniref:Isochorismatase family protein n=1 Tax=Massilia aerilata TaxID=453817 RepID=A0ABW0S0Y7_9BURK